MKLFSKTKPKTSLYEALPPEHRASIEIVAHKNAQEHEIKQVRVANEYLRELFVDKNHFTLKVYYELAKDAQNKRKTK